MKQIFPHKIVNIDYNIWDNKFLIKKLIYEKNIASDGIEVIFLSEFLEEKKNLEMLEKSKTKPATWSMVYSPKDELEIFKKIFDSAIKNSKKTHIVWVSLKEEMEILESYYKDLWFFNQEINCFDVDFSVPLVTVWVKIENLMYKWSDYKAMGEKIFFNPPVRESGQVKAMFKWINRGVISWIYIEKFDEKHKLFLSTQIKTEQILSITMSRVLNYNLCQIWFRWEEKDLIISY